MEKAKTQLPLHVLHVDKAGTAINRVHIVLYSFLVFLFLYQRLSLLFLILTQNDTVSTLLAPPPPLLTSFLLLAAELVLSFVWLSKQAFRWRPVDRSVFIDRLPEDSSQLPAVDVMICTADPDKEPTFEVMNTIVSAMSLDYPINKLHVYLSDDGGSPLTLGAMKEIWGFATWWVPFCRKYGVKCRCPMAYFQDESSITPSSDSKLSSDVDFVRNKLLIKEKYELFKKRVEVNLSQSVRGAHNNSTKTNHPSLVQVINENCIDPSIINPDYNEIPWLVYVAREKRPSHPHHFKAGALNVLLRVSGMFSNSPIVLVLDCDMYCNDPSSTKQAMCFYLDPDTAPTLGFVQFPQRFHNFGKFPMYDDDLRWAFKVLLRGMDGLGTGPAMCGTGFYLKRKALYSDCVKGLDPLEMRNKFGPSSEFAKTVSQDTKRRTNLGGISENILQEAEFVSSCSFEDETKWGDGVSSTLFPLLALVIFLSSQTKQLHEVLATGGTLASWWNEQRTWIMKILTCHTYG